MLAAQRRNLILETLRGQGSVSVNELYHRLKVSRETIRRDINRLAAENRLRKTHGGALSMDHAEPSFSARMEVNIDGKRAIGRRAAELVPDGASVIIDSGTTTLCLAEALVERHSLIVYTNDIHVAGKFAGRNDNQVLLLGGDLQGNEGATMGRDTTTMLSRYFADFAFVGAGALTAGPLLSDFSREAAELRGQMLLQGRGSVLLVDSSKFDRRAPVRVANLEKVTHIVTDARPKGALMTDIKTLAAELLVARTVK